MSQEPLPSPQLIDRLLQELEEEALDAATGGSSDDGASASAGASDLMT